ncbi:MAG: hypothetical protein ACFFCP_16195 [Promethearchaeota archaeon]
MQLGGPPQEVFLLVLALVVVLLAIIAMAAYKTGISRVDQEVQPSEDVLLRLVWSPWTQWVIALILPFCSLAYSFDFPDTISDLVLIAPVWSFSTESGFGWYPGTGWWYTVLSFSSPVLLVTVVLTIAARETNLSLPTILKLRYLVLISPVLVIIMSFVMFSNYMLNIPIPLPTTVVSQYLWHKEVVRSYKLMARREELEVREVIPADLETHPVVRVTSGYDVAGENLKIAVKVSNEGELTISNALVTLDAPDGLEFVQDTTMTQKLGTITGGSFQSVIFWLRPLRCVDDEYGGQIVFRDAKGDSHTAAIPRKRVVNVCPMLAPIAEADEVFSKLKFGALSRNCSSFEFSGDSRTVFSLAESRLIGLEPVERSEQEFDNETYLGYSCYVGETKYGDKHFAAEIQVSGVPRGGVLTLSVYSDDERILSGFMVEIMQDVRKHIQVLEERACPVATCPKCGANLDLSAVGENRIYNCSYCGVVGKAPPWVV